VRRLAARTSVDAVSVHRGRAAALAVLVVVASLTGAPGVVAAQASPSSAHRDSARSALVRDVTYLASAPLDGRATGSPGADSAANYIAQRYLALRLAAGFTSNDCDSTGLCRASYLQGFAPPAGVLRAAGIHDGAIGYNIMAIVPGTDSALSSDWIVVGAHYDHLGRTGFGVTDRRFAKRPHLGADDNASGTAAVLELARRVSVAPLRRSVMFVHFGAEELGNIGSRVFLLQPRVVTTSMVAMLNFDMVGHLKQGRLRLYGLATAKDWHAVIDRANVPPALPITRHDALSPPGSGGSDHVPFSQLGIPVLHLHTGQHRAYHSASDTVERIDFDGLLRIVGFGEQLLRQLGDGALVPSRNDARP
jgi:hypothetical protein